MKIIARIYTDFKEKFGIPRQSGIAEGAVGKIVFEKKYRNPDALRGIEEFSHLWLLWEFSEAKGAAWSPTVRPPRLGGNKKLGVFATRSPYRPNPIALSSVKLLSLAEEDGLGTVIYVSGVDILNGTPIYDIKPYIRYTDSHPDALSGFADREYGARLNVSIPPEILDTLPEEKRDTLIKILEEDPRPQYQSDGRTYGMLYSDFEVFFTVSESTLSVFEIKKKT